MSNLIWKTVDNIAADIAAGKVSSPACGPERQLAVRKQIAKTEKNCQRGLAEHYPWQFQHHFQSEGSKLHKLTADG